MEFGYLKLWQPKNVSRLQKIVIKLKMKHSKIVKHYNKRGLLRIALQLQ